MKRFSANLAWPWPGREKKSTPNTILTEHSFQVSTQVRLMPSSIDNLPSRSGKSKITQKCGPVVLSAQLYSSSPFLSSLSYMASFFLVSRPSLLDRVIYQPGSAIVLTTMYVGTVSVATDSPSNRFLTQTSTAAAAPGGTPLHSPSISSTHELLLRFYFPV